MNKLQYTVAALAFSMFTMAPAFAEDMTAPIAPTPTSTPTCTCPADKLCKADALDATDCCKIDAVGEDCTNHGGTLIGDMHNASTNSGTTE